MTRETVRISVEIDPENYCPGDESFAVEALLEAANMVNLILLARGQTDIEPSLWHLHHQLVRAAEIATELESSDEFRAHDASLRRVVEVAP